MSIIPVKNIPDTMVVYLHQTRIRSQLIYMSIVFSVVIAMISLPFIYTTISVNGQGLMQSSIEKVEVLAPSSGRLIFSNLIDNRKVSKGEVLLVLDASLPKQQGTLLTKHAEELQMKIVDAARLLAVLQSPSIRYPKLSTGFYQASWQQYVVQLNQAKGEVEQSERIYRRYQTLYNKKVVTQTEYEEHKFKYEQAIINGDIVVKKYESQWQGELSQYRKELRELENQNLQLKDQEKQYTLRATTSGSIQNLMGLQTGAYIYANQKIGEISPDSALIAYCYIKPSDIGLIKKQQLVRFQIDAFNYNQWGMITGSVLDVADDIVMQNETPYFKVKCKLHQNYLRLKNGYKGYIKKGMTFNANFLVARRSLYQLLYDKADDWLNPQKKP